MVTFTSPQGYSNSYPITWVINPSQPIAGDNNGLSLATERTLFQYDIITPYGVGNAVSNSAQTTRIMPAFGISVKCSVFTDQDLTVRLYADLYSGTFRLAETINVSASVAVTSIGFRQVPAFHLRGTFQAVATLPTTFEFHSRCGIDGI